MDHLVETDVLVVGAGPTGLATANLLADYGLRVLLAERSSTVSDEPRAISITDESLRVMQHIGILDRLKPEMLMDTGARYYGRRGQLLAEVKAAKPRLGQPAKSQFDQPVLAGLLLDAARSRPLVTVRFDTEVFGITSQRDHVDAVLVDKERRFNVRSKWIVACDGGRSTVRTQLGIPLDGSTQEQKWIVVDVLNAGSTPEPYSRFYCNGRRPAVVVPGVKGRLRFEFMLLPGEEAPQITSTQSIIDLVAPYHRIVPQDIRRAAVYTAQQRIAIQYRAGRVLLAGDAAHLMPPFAGQGLNAGIRDAWNLAWKVAANVQGRASDALVDTYASERRPHAADMVRLSLRIGKVVMATQPVLTVLRDLFVTGLGIVPPAKRWLVGMRFLKQPHFVAGCVLKSTAGVPQQAVELVGRSLSQPLVRTTRETSILLDALLGRGWALLRFSADGVLEVQRLDKAAATTERVLDDAGAFAALRGSGVTLWVRPDRYVAAACKAGEERVTAEALAPLVTDLPALWASGTRRTAVADGRPALAAQVMAETGGITLE